MLTTNYQQGIADLEAIDADPSDTHTLLNNGGVKPEETPNPAAIQKADFDALVGKYPDDYRTYMARGLFYNCFTAYDEKYYAPTLSDLSEAQRLNPNSALVAYFLGTVYQGGAMWTKAAWADTSESGGADLLPAVRRKVYMILRNEEERWRRGSTAKWR